MKRYMLQVLFLLPFVGYAVYSYALLDPNLVLSAHPLYWKFQQKMWELGYHHQLLSAWVYAGFMVAMFGAFAVLLRKRFAFIRFPVFFSVFILLFIAHPALSHDIFNYMFNAKMVVKYQADPHVRVALDFVFDDWTRFMHNTHTPAPYGYAWTGLSLLPYMLGFGKFTATLFVFKGWIIAGLGLLVWLQLKTAKLLDSEKMFHAQKWLFLLNPLVLVETIGNGHNDVWMMGIFWLSVYMLLKSKSEKRTVKRIAYIMCSILAMIVSVQIKYATILLLPMILVIYGKEKFLKLSKILPEAVQNVQKVALTYWADISAVLMLIPLATVRSQQFHPWYLIWGLSFLPFMRSQTMRIILLGFSLSSMLRYVPYIRFIAFSPEILLQQRLITWVGGFVISLGILLYQRAHVRMKIWQVFRR